MIKTIVCALAFVSLSVANVQEDQVKKGAGFEPFKSKTAIECFEEYDKIGHGNCQGGFVAACPDCDLDTCAEKCFFEHRNCRGFSYSNLTTPSCVLKEIDECSDVQRNTHYSFHVRDMECNLLPSGGLYPTQDGCAFAQTAQRCRDILGSCKPGECSTEQKCLDYCTYDPLCHGVTWDKKKEQCGLWMGRECSNEKVNKYDISYFEKYCGKNLETFEKKRLEEYKQRCQPKCPNVPLPGGGLHDGGSNDVGEIVHIECLQGRTLVGPSMLRCERSENKMEANWVPYMSDASLGSTPQCVVGAVPEPVVIKKKD